jgi:hypothetical protein
VSKETIQGLDEGEEEPEIPAPTSLPKAGLRIRFHWSLMNTEKRSSPVISNSLQFSVPYVCV